MHERLVVSAQVLLKGELKLLLGQGSVKDGGPKTRAEWKVHGQTHLPPSDGWRLRSGKWVTPGSVGARCGLAWGENATYVPCLFNESADLREQHDLSHAMPAVVELMTEELQAATARARTVRWRQERGERRQPAATPHFAALQCTTHRTTLDAARRFSGLHCTLAARAAR